MRMKLWGFTSSEQARSLKTVKDHKCDSKVHYGSDRRWNPGVPTTLTGHPSLQTASRVGRTLCYKTLVFYKVACSA